MTETQHTPLPWYADGTEIRSIGDDPRLIGDTDTSRLDNVHDRSPEDEANAAFIVRACNAHAELVRDRADLLVVVERFVATGSYGDPNDLEDALCDARAALALAKHGKQR